MHKFNKVLSILIFFVGSIVTYGQISLFKTDHDGLVIKNISTKTSIIGDLGITSYTIEVFNTLAMPLAAELEFPLLDNQEILGFSLDINGKLRKAVAVDKVKGRVAYEDIVSRNVDPALIEKTEGNNFKTRIYPVPSQGSRIIQIEILNKFVWKENDGFVFNLTLDFKEKVEKKTSEIHFIGFSEDLKLENYSAFTLKKDKEKVVLSSSTATNVEIKVIPKKKSFVFYQKHEDNYYYYNSSLVPVFEEKKEMPEKVNILWDCSRSRKGLITKEIEFLREFFKKIEKANVQVIAFNTSITDIREIKIRKGQTNKLENYLNQIKYDGATQFGCINELPQTDINLLFSDGLGNFGDTSFMKTKAPVYTISAQKSLNPNKLRYIAKENSGVFIDLNAALSINQDETILHNHSVFERVVEHQIHEYYPSSGSRISKPRIKIVGKGEAVKHVSLNFSSPTIITHPLEVIMLDDSHVNLKKLFALEKIKELSIYPEKNKDEIIELGLTHHFITDYTSLIVLESLFDYIKNEIVPPNEAWKKLYFENFKIAQLRRQIDNLEVFENQKEELEDFLTWMFPNEKENIEKDFEEFYENNYKKQKKLETEYTDLKEHLDSIRALSIPKSLPVIEIEDENNKPGMIEFKAVKTKDGFLVTGKVQDENGGLPAVNVVIKGTSNGILTDFDGSFSVVVPKDATLVFSFIGFESKEIKIDEGYEFVTFSNNVDLLEEVVVTVQETGSIYTSSDDFITNSPNIDEYQIYKYLDSIYIKKKENYIVLGSNPLIFVDRKSNEINNLDWKKPDEEIQYVDWENVFSLELISPEKSIKISDSVGKDGIIFLYTNEYVEKNEIGIPISINAYVSHELSKKLWLGSVPKELLDITNYSPHKRYQKYLQLVEKENKSPGFYMSAGDIFRDSPEFAAKIWSNIAEIQLDNHENIRTLAYLLRSIGYFKEAIPLFKRILEVRPDEPIAYRDLANTYVLNNQLDKGFEVCERALKGAWIERNAEPYDRTEELNTLYNDYVNTLRKVSKKLTVNEKKKDVYSISSDIRVVLTWTSNDTDIDLHLVTPSGKDFCYNNSESKNIRYNTDVTDGFGPEEILVKNAEKGTYNIMIDFYADRQQTIHGPVGLSLEVYKYFGTEKEERSEKVLILTEKGENILADTITF